MNAVQNLIIALTLCLSTMSCNASDKCGGDEVAKTAEQLAGDLRSWNEVGRFYARFRGCDDGSVAEGLDDSIGSLLSRADPQMEQLLLEIRKRPALKSFVKRHINEVLSVEQLSDIAANLRNKCGVTKVVASLCEEFSATARQVLDQP